MKPNVLVICGPTASGKTALAVALAQRFHGEVVSADSMQVYRGMDIGTAKPTQEEMGGVPHHMIDVADPSEDYSVARYVDQAVPIVDDILVRGKLAIIAGGTGLYIDNLIAGRQFAGPAPPPRRQAHHPGPGGLPGHGKDHLPAQPREPGHSQPIYSPDHRPELPGAVPALGPY